MVNQKESKQVRMDSWLLKLLLRDMKAKARHKNQPTNNHNKHINTYICTHTHIHICKHIYAHIHTYTYVNIYIRKLIISKNIKKSLTS